MLVCCIVIVSGNRMKCIVYLLINGFKIRIVFNIYGRILENFKY